LVREIILQYKRVEKIYQKKPLVEIDGKGVERVVNAVKSVICGIGVDLMPESNYVGDSLRTGYELIPVDDLYINKYLSARNMKSNLTQMTETTQLSRLEHYIWWLQKNKRVSYVFKKEGRELLFAWYQPKQIRGVNIVVDGWFIASNNCNALDALYAITKYYSIIDRLFSGYYFIIVIHRDNDFMNRLTSRTNFSEIDEKDNMFSIADECFPSANTINFRYYQRYIE